MPTQQQIAEHLDLSQKQVSELMERLAIDWQACGMDEIRVAYIRNLRDRAAGHRSEDGLDLVRERVLTERVDRDLKMLTLAEKRGQLVNVAQLEPALTQMVGAFRSELLARDDKLKAELDSLYGIDLDISLLNEHTRTALGQLSRYDAGGAGAAASSAGNPAAAGADIHH